MIEKTRVQKELIEYHKFCDVCGTEITPGLVCTKAECMYCGKDLCERCIGHEEETGGDYRDVWCERCWQKGDKYRPLIDALETEAQMLSEKWRRECNEKEDSI